MWRCDREQHTDSASTRAARGAWLSNRSDREAARARQEALSLAEHSQAALVHHLPPTLQPWYRGPSPATGGVSPTKRRKNKTVPTLPSQFGVLCSLGCCRTGTKCSPCAAEGTLQGSSLQGAGTSSQCRRSSMVLLKPAQHREVEHVSRKEGRQRVLTCLPPVSSPLTGSSTHYTHKPEGCALALASGSSLPQRMQWERKHRPSSWSHSVPQHPFMPAVGCGSPASLGCWPQKQAHSPQTSGPEPLAQPLGTPLRPCPWGLRTPGSCPCAPYPGHHPGSAGPERRRTRQLQRGSARHHGHQRIPAGCTAGSFPGTLLESPPSC